MIKLPVLLLLLLLIINHVKAQDSCNCRANLDSMIVKVTNNYAGYKDKVDSQTQASYQALVDSLKNESFTRKNISDCFPLLEKYRTFFYDKHLQLQLQGQQTNATALPVAGAPPEASEWNREKIVAILRAKKAFLHPLEGIWTTEGYEIGILFINATHTYKAVVLNANNKNWHEGMLKFTCRLAKNGFYSTVYYRGDFIKDTVRLTVFKNFMEVENYGNWKKTFPVSSDSISSEAFVKNHSSFGLFQFRYLNAETVYIDLRSCDISLKAAIDSTLVSNTKKLKTIPNWIVDFRNNEGGATDVFLKLLPWLYTKPFIEKGSSHWMTPDNTNELKKFMAENGSLLDAGTVAQVNKLINYGNAHPNGWYHEQGDTSSYDSVMLFPKRVAVLSNKKTVSSAETFLIAAKGLSNKVVIMGENSGGYLDYGNLLPSSLPCSKLALYIPSRRANYLDDGKSYDRTGYPPDVYIPAETKDWVQFVFDYWAKHPGGFIPHAAAHKQQKHS